MVFAYLLACGGGDPPWEASEMALTDYFGRPFVSGTLELVEETDEKAVAKVEFWAEDWHETLLETVREDIGGDIDHLGEHAPFNIGSEDGHPFACAVLYVSSSNLEEGEDLGCIE